MISHLERLLNLPGQSQITHVPRKSFSWATPLVHVPAHVVKFRLIQALQWRHNDHGGVSNHQPPSRLFTQSFIQAGQRQHQSSASLAFVRGNHRDRWIPRTKGQLRRKMFPFDDVIMDRERRWSLASDTIWHRRNGSLLPVGHGLFAWWHHQMETSSALLALCAGNSPVTDKFPSQRSVTRSFHVFFDLRLNVLLSKQS